MSAAVSGPWLPHPLGDVMAEGEQGSGTCREPTSFADLCAGLTGDDDSEHLLAIAQAALNDRLAAVSKAVHLTERGVGTSRISRPEANFASRDADGCTAADVTRFLIAWFSGEGSELRRISQAATGDRCPHTLLFGLYERCYSPGMWPDRLRALAGAVRGSETTGLVDERDPAIQQLHEAVFLRLSLSCFPVGRFPEILGYALAEVREACLLPSLFKAAKGCAPIDLGLLEAWARDVAQERHVLGTALKALRRPSSGAARKSLAARVALGIAFHDALTKQVFGALAHYWQRRVDVVDDFVRVLIRKAPFAQGYHRSVEISGRRLDQWFGDRPFKASAFLTALASSAWVDRNHPERSPILDLLRFEGPMFGIFTPGEEDSLRAWLAALTLSPSGGDSKPALTVMEMRCRALEESPRQTAVTANRSTRPQAYAGTGARDAASPAPRASRSLFYRLVNVEDYPSVLPLAKRYVEKCLRRVAGSRQHRHGRFVYSESDFEFWLDDLYQRQLRPPSAPRSVPRLPRDAYVFGIEQLAPAILVDGCWLQRVDSLATVSSPVARRLFAIYADEMGNGDIERNHAHIYRGLLESLGIDCPPVDSERFAACSRFLGSAFDLPVLLLSISLHTHRFLPELLGLNLAIELSGLGTAYSQAARDLAYWGIDSRIVRLHQSVDNLASGHAALAKESIMLHLRQIRGLGGDPASQTHWLRMQMGYDLLRVVNRTFKCHLVTAYLARRASASLRGWVRRMSLT